MATIIFENQYSFLGPFLRNAYFVYSIHSNSLSRSRKAFPRTSVLTRHVWMLWVDTQAPRACPPKIHVLASTTLSPQKGGIWNRFGCCVRVTPLQLLLLRFIVTLSCAHETSISNQSPGVHDEFRLSCSTHDLPGRLAKRQLVPKKGLIRQQSAIPTSSNLLFPLQLFDSSEGILLANGCVPNAFFSTENQRGPALAEEASSWNLQPKTMNSFDLFKRAPGQRCCVDENFASQANHEVSLF